MVQGVLFVLLVLAVAAMKATYQQRVYLTIFAIAVLLWVRFGKKKR